MKDEMNERMIEERCQEMNAATTGEMTDESMEEMKEMEEMTEMGDGMKEGTTDQTDQTDGMIEGRGERRERRERRGKGTEKWTDWTGEWIDLEITIEITTGRTKDTQTETEAPTESGEKSPGSTTASIMQEMIEDGMTEMLGMRGKEMQGMEEVTLGQIEGTEAWIETVETLEMLAVEIRSERSERTEATKMATATRTATSAMTAMAMNLSETLVTQTPVTPPVTSGRIDLEIDLIGVAHPLPGTSGTPGIDLTEVTEDVAASKVATREMNVATVATVATRRGDTETETTQKGAATDERGRFHAWKKIAKDAKIECMRT